MTYVVFIFVLCLYVKLKMDMMSKSAWGDVDQPAPIVPKFRREKKKFCTTYIVISKVRCIFIIHSPGFQRRE